MSQLDEDEVIRLFWEQHPHCSIEKIKNHSGQGTMFKADTRCAFVDFVDSLHRDGQISDDVAQNITLE